MKKVFIITIVLAFISAQAVFAQSKGSSYKTALGVKFYPGAITLKHFVKSDAALEGIGYFWQRGARVTGLYEFHGNISGARGLKWYAGPGAHVGFYNDKYYNGGTSVGLDGVLGLDYKISGAPINFSLDWQPSFEFGDYYGFGNWGGFAIRFTF